MFPPELVEDVEAHTGDPALYNFNVFHKNHDSQVTVSRVRLGMPVCADSRDAGMPFLLPLSNGAREGGPASALTPFEKSCDRDKHLLPPNSIPTSWAFVRGSKFSAVI
ncbi:hypothetical protein ACSQ67_024664 [Phaseolus vulgaris]